MVDATARLYDVNEDTLVFHRLQQKKSYDQGTITFRARKGSLIDLAKLHESIWATRLSGGTSSGLVSLEVTAIGTVTETDEGIVLKIADSDAEFVLGKHRDNQYSRIYKDLGVAGMNRVVRVSGLIDNYRGRWPGLLKQPPPKQRRILVTNFEVVK